MREKTKKEILTKEKIKNELKDIYIHNLLIRCLYILLFVLCSLCIYGLISNHLSLKDNYASVGITLLIIQYGITIIIFGTMLFFIVYNIYKFISLMVLVCKNKFDIVTDKLVNKEKDGGHKIYIMEYSIDEMELHDHRKPYVFLFPKIEKYLLKKGYITNKLCFAKHKDYYLPEGKLYRWSEKYKMDHWAVYRWAEIGDEFYVVTIKGKVAYVYNTKHFEFKE